MTLSRDNFPRINQCVACFASIPGLISEDVSEMDVLIAFLRRLHDDPKTSPEQRQNIAVGLTAADIPMEPGPEEIRFRTRLFVDIQKCFEAPTKLIEAQTAEERLKANIGIKTAQRDLERIHKNIDAEMKSVTAAALNEFAIAAFIARSDDPGMTREKVLEQWGKAR